MSSVDIFPAVGASENVLDLFGLHVLAFKVAPFYHHLIGTCPALEAVLGRKVRLVQWQLGGRCGNECEEIATSRTDWKKSVL